jgi:quercetin dioxygenase-like cupin family protein
MEGPTMSVAHARSGDLLELDPAEARTGLTGAVALVRDERLEVMRWVLPAGRAVPEHLAYGPVTVQCVSGEAALLLRGGERRLRPGTLAYLAAGERHALRAESDAVLIVTMVLAAPPEGDAPLPASGAPAPLHGERTGAGPAGK